MRPHRYVPRIPRMVSVSQICQRSFTASGPSRDFGTGVKPRRGLDRTTSILRGGVKKYSWALRWRTEVLGTIRRTHRSLAPDPSSRERLTVNWVAQRGNAKSVGHRPAHDVVQKRDAVRGQECPRHTMYVFRMFSLRAQAPTLWRISTRRRRRGRRGGGSLRVRRGSRGGRCSCRGTSRRGGGGC